MMKKTKVTTAILVCLASSSISATVRAGGPSDWENGGSAETAVMETNYMSKWYPWGGSSFPLVWGGVDGASATIKDDGGAFYDFVFEGSVFSDTKDRMVVVKLKADCAFPTGAKCYDSEGRFNGADCPADIVDLTIGRSQGYENILEPGSPRKHLTLAGGLLVPGPHECTFTIEMMYGNTESCSVLHTTSNSIDSWSMVATISKPELTRQTCDQDFDGDMTGNFPSSPNGSEDELCWNRPRQIYICHE